MISQIKDKHKLFSKLFLSATFSQQLQPPLLVSPNFITLLLEQSKSLPIHSQTSIINDILLVFIQRPLNSFLLNQTDRQLHTNFVDKNILDEIIIRILQIVTTQSQVDVYMQKITILISYYRITLKNINKLTQWLSMHTHLQKFNPLKLRFILRVLQLYYGNKTGIQKAPQYYFYLLGTQSSSIKSVQHNQQELAFKNDLCISLSFCSHGFIEGNPKNIDNLCLIKTNKNQKISIAFHQNSILLSFLKDSKIQQIKCFQNLSQYVWYRLLVNLSASQTEICINEKSVQFKPFLKKQRQRKITQCYFGCGFFGMLTGITIANKVWSLEKFTFQGYPYGIQNWDSLITLNKISLNSSVLLSCLPFSTFQIRDNNLCFDIFRRNHSTVGQNIHILQQSIMESKINHLGGFKIILPLFYLARFYDVDKYKTLLEDLLSILLTIFQTYDYSHLDQELNTHIQILGRHIYYLPSFYTTNSLKLIQSIHKKIFREPTRASYVGNILWSLNMKEVIDEEVIKEFYRYMIRVYESERTVAYKGYSFTQIIYWMIQNFENQYGYNCCFQHYINESVLAKDFSLTECNKLNDNKKLHYSYLQIILANILQNCIIGKKQQSPDLIKTLIRPILHKYSPCLYSTVLKVIKRQINKFKGEKSLLQLLSSPKLDILSYLIFLSQKTINTDIISDIVYLSLYLSKHMKYTQEIVNFVLHLLRRMQQFSKIKFNPILHAVKKVRSNSIISSTSSHQQPQQRKAKSSQAKIKYKIKNQPQQQHPYNPSISNSNSLEQVVKLVQKCRGPNQINNSHKLYNIVMNYVNNQISQEPIQAFNILSEEGLKVLNQYYYLVDPQFKTNILIHLLSAIEENKNIRLFHQMKVMVMGIINTQLHNPNIQTIFAKIIVQSLQTNTLCEYYHELTQLCQNKEPLWQIISIILPKVIKAFNTSQLCSTLVLFNYEFYSYDKEQFICKILYDIVSQLQIQTLHNCNNYESIDDKIANIQLFNQHIIHVPQQQHTFSIQLILSKIISEQEGSLSQQSEEIMKQKQQYEQQYKPNQSKQQLSEQCKEQSQVWQSQINKELNVMEVYLNTVYTLIQHHKQQTHTLINNFASIIQLFIHLNIHRHNYQQHKSYLRYIIYYLTHKAIIHSPNTYQHIWTHILSQLILPHINEQIHNYQQLSDTLVEKNISPIFIQDLQIFIKSLPYSQLQHIHNQPNTLQLIQQIVKSQQFISSLQFNNKISSIIHQIDSFNQQLLLSQYKKIDSSKVIKNKEKEVSSEISESSNGKSKNKFKRNIQKLFDTENVQQQNTRIKYLHDQECIIRNCHYIWQKIWDQLRVYHHSYAFWMAQRDHPHQFSYPPSSSKIRNFKYQMSQYSSNSGMYAILQPKMQEPWHIIKDIRRQKSKYMTSFSQMMKPSHSKELQSPSPSSQNSKFVNIWKSIWNSPIVAKKPKKVKQYDVIWIQRSVKALGKIFIKDSEQIIFFYEGIKQEDSHLSFQKFSLAFNQKTYCQWNIFQIKKLKIHRYLMKYTALQIVFYNSKSLIFDFPKGNRRQFLKELEKIQRQRVQAAHLKLFKINNIAFFRQDFFKLESSDDKVTQLWRKREISNLQYLIEINKKASRGIYDLSQYMVAPWIIEIKNQKEPSLRPLQKTIGALGSEERKKILHQKYHTKDPFNPFPPFFYGTHYSSPGVVFNFLIRLSPFTQYCKHLQGGKFDIPDRLFSSFVNAWKSAYSEVSDIRQLVPQFYYLPQLFLNLDQYNFGVTQNQQKVNNVQLPSWATQNPYFFTWQMKSIMESDSVSEKLNNWIDLIFGYKQRGKQAQQNWNVYYYLTYEDSASYDKEDDEIYQKSKEAQIVHFGQIPPLLFEKPHVKRESRKVGACHLDYVQKIKLMISMKEKPIGIHINSNDLYIVKRNVIEILSLQSNPASLQKTKKFSLEKSQTQNYFLIKKEKSNVVFLNKGYFICWGYFNNEFRIFNINNGNLQESDYLDERITTVKVNHEEDLIIIGTISGLLHIYEIQFGLTQLFLKKIAIETFPAPISHISQYDGFFAISFGNMVSIYKIHRTLHYLCSREQHPVFKFFRSFKSNIPIKASFILNSPLFCIAIIDNANIQTYSINGQFLKKISSNAKYFGRFIDADMQDVIYAIEQDKIVAFSIPDLRSVSIIEIEDYDQIQGQYIMTKNSIWQLGYINIQ